MNQEPCIQVARGFNKLLERLQGISRLQTQSIQNILAGISCVVLQPYMSSNFKFEPGLLKLRNELLKTVQLLSSINCLNNFQARSPRTTCSTSSSPGCSRRRSSSSASSLFGYSSTSSSGPSISYPSPTARCSSATSRTSFTTQTSRYAFQNY